MMDSAVLATLIMDKMESKGLAPRNPLAGGHAIALYTAIAEAVVEHIQSSATVTDEAGTYNIQ